MLLVDLTLFIEDTDPLMLDRLFVDKLLGEDIVEDEIMLLPPLPVDETVLE